MLSQDTKDAILDTLGLIMADVGEALYPGNWSDETWLQMFIDGRNSIVAAACGYEPDKETPFDTLHKNMATILYTLSQWAGGWPVPADDKGFVKDD